MKDKKKLDAPIDPKEPIKYCLDCNEVLGKGRTDRKFCDGGCRSNYNFKHGSSNKDIVKKINQTLRKNRDILKELNTAPDGKTTVSRKLLVEEGFHFTYFTSIYETEKGDQYFYCYDVGYLLLRENKVLIVIKDNFPKVTYKKYASKDSQPAYLNDSE